jgi:hypothetical protein
MKMFTAWECPNCSYVLIQIYGKEESCYTECPSDNTQLEKIKIDDQQAINLVKALQ